MDISSLKTDGTRAHLAPFLPDIPDNGKPVARLHFDTLADLAALVPEDAPRNAHDTHGWANYEKNKHGNARTMADALRMAREGWREGAERARPLLDRVKVARPTKRSLVRYDVAGAVPSVPRYLAGNLLNMRTFQRSATSQRPVITIVASTAAPWFVEAGTFEGLAVAAMAIVDRLEDTGFRVEIIAGRRESSETGNNNAARKGTGENNRLGYRSEMFFRLKAADDALDLDRVAFGIGHPAVHRRILFAAGGIHPDYKDSLGMGQGYAVGLSALERPPGTYILPSLASLHNDNVTDPVAIFDRAVATLRDQGCPGLAEE